jgi:hypothetical protein
MKSEPQRITSIAELDALVGQYVTEEVPETYWEDSHGYFQFHSEVEARRALGDPYYQRFLTDVDWSKTIIREVQVFRPYSADPAANWFLCEKAILRFGPARLSRETGRWHASFGTSAVAEARTPTIAICLAALRAAGIHLLVDHDRIDFQLRQGGHAYDFHDGQRTPIDGVQG